ncbi:LSU ribosomal protein L13p (L13Ae) [hydrothermal vent metagenome]|uniref:LSU ribosomal protein L13p (L13Ae) n=1 Tax=hydrothermal vent metagenome TaxID=652676 RepID=A0A3B1DBH5_9ZZZZ
MIKTFMAKKEIIEPGWFLLDVDGMIVGRIATQIAKVLMGKNKPTYTPHVDCGDYVVVVNAERIRFSGESLSHESHPYFSTKMHTSTYERYSGYPSGRKIRTAADLLESKPEMILQEAVRRMLPKNKLGRVMLKKLRLFVGTEHEHQAQKPEPWPDYLMPSR